jgi:hypothetical protein
MLLFARDAPAREYVPARVGSATTLAGPARDARTASWAAALAPLEVRSLRTGTTCSLRLYARDGEIDDAARTCLERALTGDEDPKGRLDLRDGQGPADGPKGRLEPRLEQLVVKAAYHFGGARILALSGWRAHSGRHSSGEALDFKLEGVPAAKLAAYLRGLPRVGVGIYIHPRTQYVHLDVREPSFHWIDASPPGVTRKERRLRDPGQAKRDASWTADSDLP